MRTIFSTRSRPVSAPTTLTRVPSAAIPVTSKTDRWDTDSGAVVTAMVTPRSAAMVSALTKVTGSSTMPENRPRTADRPSTFTSSVESSPRASTSRRTGALASMRPTTNPSFRASSSHRATSSLTCPPDTLTASATNSPARALSTLAATSVPARSCASAVEAPRCGVTTTSGRSNRGLSVHGSVVNTSKPAPRMCPDRMASARACSLTSPPRAALMMICPFLAFANSSASNMPAVSGVFGR